MNPWKIAFLALAGALLLAAGTAGGYFMGDRHRAAEMRLCSTEKDMHAGPDGMPTPSVPNCFFAAAEVQQMLADISRVYDAELRRRR